MSNPKDIEEKKLQDVKPGEVPAGVRVAGLKPEFGERFANLVASVTTGIEHAPRTRHNTYEGGFDDARHFVSSAVTHLRQMVDDDEVFARGVTVLLAEVIRNDVNALASAYDRRADLAEVLAARVAKAL